MTNEISTTSFLISRIACSDLLMQSAVQLDYDSTDSGFDDRFIVRLPPG